MLLIAVYFFIDGRLGPTPMPTWYWSVFAWMGAAVFVVGGIFARTFAKCRLHMGSGRVLVHSRRFVLGERWEGDLRRCRVCLHRVKLEWDFANTEYPFTDRKLPWYRDFHGFALCIWEDHRHVMTICIERSEEECMRILDSVPELKAMYVGHGDAIRGEIR